MTNALVITRGNDRTFSVAAKDALGVAADLTGDYLWFTAKYSYDDDDAHAALRKNTGGGGGMVVTNAPGGLVDITITAADTETLVADPKHRHGMVLHWDLKNKDDEGKRSTLARGTLVIEADVTRAND